MEALFLSFLLNLAIAYLTLKDGPQARKYGLSEFQVPTATEDRAQSIPFGPTRIAGNCIYYGNYSAKEAKKDIPVLFGLTSTTQSLGYEYSLTLWYTLAGVCCDEVVEILQGERSVWKGSLPLSRTVPTSLNVKNKYFAAEGADLQEGIDGVFTFYNYELEEGSDASPTAVADIEALLKEPVPTYPNTLHVTYTGFVGTSPNLTPLTFVVKRKPDIKAVLTSGVSVTYPVAGNLAPGTPAYTAAVALIASAGDISGDANLALAELEMLTTRANGIGVKLSSFGVDVSSYFQAAKTLKDEGIGVAFNYDVSKPMTQTLKDMAAVAASTRETSDLTGQIRMRLIRDTEAPVMTFDASNIVALNKFELADVSTAPNIIQVPYIDRENGWIERIATVKNPAGVRAAGKQISERLELIGMSRGALATQLGNRQLVKYALPLATASFTGVIPMGFILKPFDVITFVHPTKNKTLRMRIISVRFATVEGKIRAEIEAVQDVFRNGETAAVSTPGASTYAQPVAPVAPVAPSAASIMLAPYALHGEDYDHPLYYAVAADEATTELHIGYQSRPVWDASLQASYTENKIEPAIQGTVVSTVTSMQAAPSIALTLSNNAKTRWLARNRGQVFLLAGYEWLACSNWALVDNILTGSNVQRGVFDSTPARLVSGSTVTLLIGFAVVPGRMKTYWPINSTTLDGTNSFVVRAEARGRGGVVEVNDASASERVVNYGGSSAYRASRTLPPSRITLDGLVGAPDIADALPTIIRKNATTATATVTYTGTASYRLRTNRNVTDWFTATSDAGTIYGILQFQGNDGSWNNLTLEQASSTGSMAFSFTPSMLTAGARKMRVRFTSKSGNAISDIAYSHFNVTA